MMQIPEKNAELIWRELDDGTVIIDPDQGDVKVLNQVGARAWELVDGNRSVDQIAGNISQEFDVSKDEIVTDLKLYFSELADKGLIAWLEVDN